MSELEYSDSELESPNFLERLGVRQIAIQKAKEYSESKTTEDTVVVKFEKWYARIKRFERPLIKDQPGLKVIPLGLKGRYLTDEITYNYRTNRVSWKREIVPDESPTTSRTSRTTTGT